MKLKLRSPLVAVPVLAALVVAGCGGVRRHVGRLGRRRRRRRQDQALARRLLDARRSSTTRSSRDFQQDRGRQGRRLQDVLRRLGRPEPRGRGRPEGRRRDVLDRARHDAARRRRPRRRRLERRRRTRASCRTLGRLVRRAQGQPEEHPDLGRPAQAGRQGPHARTRSPRAPRSGTCWPPTARRRRRRGPAGRPRLRARAASPSTSRSRTSRAARRCRTSPRATATCCSPTSTRRSTAQKKGEEVDYVIPDDTIKIENPIAVVTKPSTPSRPRRSSTTCSRRRRSSSFADVGLPAGRRRRSSTANDVEVPEPDRPVHDRATSAAGRKVNDEFFDPEKGSIAKIEEDAGVSTAK